MSHTFVSRFALWLTATASLVVVPLLTQAVDLPSNMRSQAWPERSLASYGNSEQSATDHIMVQWAGEAPRRIAVASDSTVTDTIRYWSAQDNVEFAEPDYLFHALTVAQSTSWGYDNVQAAAAATTNGVTGAGVVVAVVDSGVDYLHEDLDANNWVNSGETPDNNTDDDGNGYVDDYYGYDFIGSLYTAVTPDTDPQDEAGHGTHVAGIIAAENNTVGVKGIAPSAQIMPVKVLDASGSGWESTIADGIRYAVDEGADIINLSLGSPYPSNTIKSAIDYAETNNVLLVAAAGNDYTYMRTSYPAGYASVVSVGATNEDGYKADYSNWGKVDVMAPGDDILSSVPGNSYARYSGTSMAAPHVSGVAALIMQKFGTTAKATRQILEHTADDFGTIGGVDYLSGHGSVNALDATGTQTASVIVYADAGTIVTNGSNTVTIYASVRNASNAAITGDTVTWSTSVGTLSASSSVTDSTGVASVTLTVDDADGLVNVTADPASTTADLVQLALLSDVPTLPVIGVTPYDASDNTSLAGGSDALTLDEGDEVTDTVETEDNIYQAGDQIQLYAYPTEGDMQTHDVTLTYNVTDSAGNAVSGLSGSSYSIATGELFFGVFYLPQTYWTSVPLTIPDDATSGEYTLSVTATENDTHESSSTTSNFWVNDQPDVLIVATGGCFEASIEGLSLGGVTSCSHSTQNVANTMADLGYTTMIWDTDQLGTPTNLADYSLVVWLDTDLWPADYKDTIQTYLDAGGNLLLSSASMEYTYADPSFYWDYLHSQYVSTMYEPTAVTGTTDGLFAGQTFDIDPYNLAGTGTRTNYMVNELAVNTDDGVNALQFTDGNGADRSAGVQVDTDTYRLLFLAFQLPGINDTGDATLENFLSTATDWLRGDQQTISRVKGRHVKNSGNRTITIRGTNFQTTGTTQVKLHRRQLSDVVVESRTKITATVPAGLRHGTYSLTVTNPDGRSVTRAHAIRIRNGGLTIQSLSADYASNNSARDLTITGSHFRSAAKVYLGNTQLSNVTYNDSMSLTVKIPAQLAAGHYKIKVQNPNGDLAKHKRFQVRMGFTQDLVAGDTSDQVKALERRLKTYSYFSGHPNTKFTSATEEALVRYQTDNFLAVTGKLDAATRYYLNNNQ